MGVMNCKNFQELIKNSHSQPLTEEMYQHISSCEGCRILFEFESSAYFNSQLAKIKTDDFFYTRIQQRLNIKTNKTTHIKKWLVAASVLLLIIFSGKIGSLIGDQNSIVYRGFKSTGKQNSDLEYFTLISQNTYSETYFNLISNE